MILNLLARLIGMKSVNHKHVDVVAKIAEADALRAQGKLHEAIEVYRACLEIDKFNVNVLNSLGASLDDIGDEHGGQECFELAYSIDDTFIAGVVNFAKKLADKRTIAKALPLLEHVYVCEPTYSHLFPIYASTCFNRGELDKSRHFYLKGWLGNFDSLRAANTYLFALAYSADERELASEHKFWSETLRHVDLEADLLERQREEGQDAVGAPPLDGTLDGRKLRIGYWSPDLRNHSVRYFFRPLLENHDRSRYEIHVYHDSIKSDEQTKLISDACDHFHDVYLMNDVQLYELMRSHRLDILVEMAGHTSTNRLMLFKDNRFAKLQISGIGYPPTTGISSIDAKILDVHIAGNKDEEFYVERPMVLPASFWCFDPMEPDVPKITDDLPLESNGYVTFACVGNISKISKDVLAAWLEILARVPSSRLLIRSINFEDHLVWNLFSERMATAGFDMNRVDLKPPVGGGAFFDSYNEIDIILDTYPFNGGTTTCFATYMGVPVITLAGSSLLSRMGMSAMANLGAKKWVAESLEEYVNNAVEMAEDVSFLRQFRVQARTSLKESPLGNGRLFAADFEKACEVMLRENSSRSERYRDDVAPLPANELMRRVYGVWSSGNASATVRILNHCLDNYPNHGAAHIFISMQLMDKGEFEQAAQYLAGRIDRFSTQDQVAAMLSLVRCCLLADDHAKAHDWLNRLKECSLDDAYDRQQFALYDACLSPSVNHEARISALPSSFFARKIVVVVPCDDPEYFSAMEFRLRSVCIIPDGLSVSYVRCPEVSRHSHYRKWLDSSLCDVLVVMQKNVEVINENFYRDVLEGLLDQDILGAAGAARWVRANWRTDAFEYKSAGFVRESGEKDGYFEIQCLGVNGGVLADKQVVLDGMLLAIRVDQVCSKEFDVELAMTDYLLEEDWTYQSSMSGAKLAAHRNLGILLHDLPQQDRRARYPGLQRLQEKYQFPLFSMVRDDGMVLSVPVSGLQETVAVMERFWLANDKVV